MLWASRDLTREPDLAVALVEGDVAGASRALANGVVRISGADTTELAIDGSFTVSGPLETFANAGGVHVARALLARGEEVVGIDNFSPYYDPILKFARLKPLKDDKGFTFIEADISDRDTMLALADYASHPEFSGYEVIVVPPEEAHAADALGTGDHVILPEGHPKTTAALQARGFKVLATPMSEFGAADGGITCLALVW